MPATKTVTLAGVPFTREQPGVLACLGGPYDVLLSERGDDWTWDLYVHDPATGLVLDHHSGLDRQFLVHWAVARGYLTAVK